MTAIAAGEIGQLEQAFQAFNRLSTELEDSYRSLELEVARLNGQLEAARAERDQQAARLAQVLAALPAAVVVLDSRGRVTDTNAETESVFGRDLKGKAWSEVANAAFGEPQAGGDLTTSDGKRLSLRIQELPDGGRILLFTDVTETRALEELVARNERLSAMGQMAASLAHQIRTPLASAMLYLSEARDGAGKTQNELVGRGVERLHDLEKLVRDMLVFARGTAPATCRVRIADIMADLHRAVTPLAPTNCHLVIDGNDALLEIEGNRSALVTALSNLVSNAFEASPGGVVVTIGARVTAGRVEFSVRDNGPGIDPGLAQRVFEPFFSTRAAGTGLGLAVVKTVTEAHGGEVQLKPADEGGTHVGIDLPNPRARGAQELRS